MMKSVAKSLIEAGELNQIHMAKLFVKEYFSEPNRGYGQNVIEVFKKLRKNKFHDVCEPAQEQFAGSGSYGNGGAMRIAPVALYFYNNYDGMVDAAKKSTEITHTNPIGVHGAILQCIAVHQALVAHPDAQNTHKNFCEEFCTNLIDKIKVIEAENDDG